MLELIYISVISFPLMKSFIHAQNHTISKSFSLNWPPLSTKNPNSFEQLRIFQPNPQSWSIIAKASPLANSSVMFLLSQSQSSSQSDMDSDAPLGGSFLLCCLWQESSALQCKSPLPQIQPAFPSTPVLRSLPTPASPR